MWRVAADIDFGGNGGTRRSRYNPFEEESERGFFERYRFTKPVFEELLDVVGPSLERLTARHDAIDPTLQLCTGLRYFAQGGYLPMVGDAHGLSPRATGNCVHAVATALCDNMQHFIQWPDVQELQATKFDFYQDEGWPSIVGLIDGTHVPLHTPFRPADEAAYVNRKGFHSINVQIVCDRRLKIFNLDARYPGSAHDAYILRNSHVWDQFEANGMANSWLLGDSGYPLKRWLLTPFLHPADEAEERFNRRHKQIRSAVERCNGVLKMRFRCLTKPMMFQPARSSRIIAACGALHNFALAHNVDLPQDADDFEDDNLAVNANFVIEAAPDRARDSPGVIARRNVVDRLFRRP